MQTLLVLAVLLSAQGDKPLTAPVDVTVTAIRATLVERATDDKQPQKDYGPGLEQVRPALRDLDFNTFRLVKNAQSSVKPGEETKFAINDRYSLYLTPIGRDTEDRIRVSVQIKEKVKKKVDGKEKVVLRQALSTTCAVVAGKPLRLGGLKLDEGQLVVIVVVRG